ncbi:MAG: tetratricopeptide repeat protein [Alphaproteobacteria bacterium]|nr:tetratricopeptide repeat protein [Alphaproteobacteria bacterium]
MWRTSPFLAVIAAGLALAGCATTPPPPPVAPYMAPEAQFLIGRVADLRGDSAGAAASFLDAARTDTGNPVIVTSALRASLQAGDFRRALEAAQYADALGLATPEGQLTLAVDALTRRKFAIAEAHLGEVHGSPLTRAARDTLGAWTAAARGKTDAALALLDTDPASPLKGYMSLQRALILDRAGRTSDALAAFEEAETGGLRTTQTRVMQARVLERAGRRADALALLSRGAAASGLERAERARIEQGRSTRAATTPEQGAALGFYTLAALLIGQAPADLATPYLTLALALDPGLDAARVAYAEALQGDEEVRETTRDTALRVLDDVAPGSPYAAVAQVQRAYILLDLGREDDALAAARAAASGGDPAAQRALGDLYRRRDRFAEAEDVYDRLIAAAPETPDWRLVFARAAMRERLGRWEDAEKDLQHALDLSPRQPEVMNYLAYAWVERGERLDEALSLLNEAVALSPDSGHIIDSLGWAHFRRGEYDLALVHLERAVELEPNNAEVNDHLGDLYWRLGRKREAGFQWTRALALDPDAAMAARLKAKVASGLPDAPKTAPLAKAP